MVAARSACAEGGAAPALVVLVAIGKLAARIARALAIFSWSASYLASGVAVTRWVLVPSISQPPRDADLLAAVFLWPAYLLALGLFKFAMLLLWLVR